MMVGGSYPNLSPYQIWDYSTQLMVVDNIVLFDSCVSDCGDRASFNYRLGLKVLNVLKLITEHSELTTPQAHYSVCMCICVFTVNSVLC